MQREGLETGEREEGERETVRKSGSKTIISVRGKVGAEVRSPHTFFKGQLYALLNRKV